MKSGAALQSYETQGSSLAINGKGFTRAYFSKFFKIEWNIVVLNEI